MSIIRNVAGQVIPLGVTTDLDGAEITSEAGWTVTVAKDGVSGAAAGTLTFAGGYWYAPTQGETDAAAILVRATRADTVPLSQAVITQEHARSAVGDILTDTAEIGTAGAGLTNLGDTRLVNLNATVGSRAAPGDAMQISVGTGAGQINVASGKVPATVAAGDIATDAITAAAVKADAVTKIQSGLSTLTAAQVWNRLTADLTADNSIGKALATFIAGITSLAAWLRAGLRKDTADATAKAEINSGGGTYAEATDSQEGLRDTLPAAIRATAAEVAAAVAGTTITITRGDTLTASITGLGNLTGYSKIWVTGKSQERDADASALFQVEIGAGMTRFNGAAEATPAKGSITIDDLVAGNITLTIDADRTAQLDALAGGVWDAQWRIGTETTSTKKAKLVVERDVTQATS